MPAQTFYRSDSTRPSTRNCNRQARYLRPYGRVESRREAPPRWNVLSLAERKQTRNTHVLRHLAILGCQEREDLDLVRRIDSFTASSSQDVMGSKGQIVEKYGNVFSGSGQYQKEYRIQLRPGAVPVVPQAKPFAYGKRQTLKETQVRLNAKES